LPDDDNDVLQNDKTSTSQRMRSGYTEEFKRRTKTVQDQQTIPAPIARFRIQHPLG
jgi:hypothetical protein